MGALKVDFPIIDAHHHFWDLSLGKHPWLCDKNIADFRYGDYSNIKQSYLFDNYLEDSANFNITKTIHVEAEWCSDDPVGETRWLTQYYDLTGFPNAIVGQVSFEREDLESTLRGHSESPLVRSVRQKPHFFTSIEEFVPGVIGSMADPRFRRGFKELKKYNFHFDLQTPWWHLGEAAELAKDFPETLIILNHTGLPSDRSKNGINGWKEKMEMFADKPNTAVKISGICVPGEAWDVSLNKDLVLKAIEIFGVDRCMFASNFPVDKLLASFLEIYRGFEEITKMMSISDRRKLFHDNALKYYSPI